MGLYILVFGFPGFIAMIDFVGFVFTGRRIVGTVLLRITEVCSMLILPYMYLNLVSGPVNNCCGDSAPFSPDHQITIYTVIALCLLAYFYSSFRKEMAGPIVEIVSNALLIICIVLNIFIAIHVEESIYVFLGNIPIILLSILAIAKNHQLFMESNSDIDLNDLNKIERLARKVLQLKPVVKFPIIFIFCIPVLFVVTALLLIVGQKPDSLIRAFTDTYKHGLSQWDYKCDNVQCGGHYLCSVAAKGHTNIVRPQRYGVRNGGKIICNRQLLVSNAFEELVQETFPSVHKIIRKQYNRVGDVVHRYYNFFDIKLVSDIVYILMKPLEWFFLITLYSFDRKPENRIAKQYLSIEERRILKDK
ncbi:hypothetical protein LK994_06815 [Ferruginibacter lapsinanis]|uniref:DUF6688 domain-containing protein n=1 Tax=Ferruginibacter lapsinanis TaxID=563172 RepID=UPI001E63B759|nr:DUF6688 family protein [Ferruginibacter lapsinanis]UEG51185.1 hypothetical protein LK994_06815 [Ferruginibacter lapsinanis]